MRYRSKSASLNFKSLVFPLNFVYFKVWLQNAEDTNNYNLKTSIGFQYSHHVYYQNGTIQHANQTFEADSNYLNGIALTESLEPVKGTDIIPATQINYQYIKPY